MTDAKRTTFQSPKGTRDFYPQDLLRRRYIIDTWRRVSLRHGFEEIDGPTFEDSALYTVKSGEGILNELFGAYSGKDPNDTKQVQGGGPPPFALRPEFTPTLARMYAARAKQLPQPTKWFCVSNFFRAERPQRGRLREFWQWNADVLGGETISADSELISSLCDSMIECGLGPESAVVKFSHRGFLTEALLRCGIHEAELPMWFALFDRMPKMKADEFDRELTSLAGDERTGSLVSGVVRGFFRPDTADRIARGQPRDDNEAEKWKIASAEAEAAFSGDEHSVLGTMDALERAAQTLGLSNFIHRDPSIVRGLAYYTGTVFELIAEGERAVAGGGRYDKLIELFGGPPTPAVGFGMGDVVLTNLLDDRKLMPEGRDLLEATSRPLPVRPDVFVIANENEDSQARLVPTVAALRRGVETDKYKQGECKPWSTDRYAPTLGGTPPLHARRSYKATKNIGKLLSEATACHARYALIIENGELGTLKNLDTSEQVKDVSLVDVGRRIAL